MARGINKVTILGRMGKEPDQIITQTGSKMAKISVATSESWKDKLTGELKKETEWHQILFFNKLADVVCQYLHKGSHVYVEGRLKTRKYQDQNGADRYTLQIIGTSLQMLDSKPAAQTNENVGNQAQEVDQDFEDDQIPF